MNPPAPFERDIDNGSGLDAQAAILPAERDVHQNVEQPEALSAFWRARYAGEPAILNRDDLWKSWAVWRGVKFVSSRSGYAAQRFDEFWQEHYGRAYDEYGYANRDYVPPAMRMPLADPMALLKVPSNFTKDDILAAFRREVKKAHPDAGGTAEMFERLVKARDRLLASIGTSAPAPKPPTYAPKGAHLVYRSVRVDGAPNAAAYRLSVIRHLAFYSRLGFREPDPIPE